VNTAASIRVGDAEIVLRPYAESDRAYVLSTWERSGRSMLRGISTVRFRAAIEGIVESLPIIIACSPRSHDTILGWATGHSGKVVYAYVPMRMRGMGIGRALIGGLP